MRDTGSLLGFTSVPVLLALLVSVPVLGSRSTVPPPRTASAADTAESPAPAPTAEESGDAYVDRLLARVAGSKVTTARVMVMLVPDPHLSSMDWMYDSHQSALRRAMEQAGYVADRFYQPAAERRVAVPAPGGLGIDSLLESEALPGVRVFRKGSVDSLAVVLTVGELPTTGVHLEALKVALRVAERLDPDKDTIRILGPTFSGSVPSLRSVLHGWTPATSGRRPCFEVVSGSATATANQALLARAGPCGEEAKDERVAPGVFYHATVHTDAALQSAVLEHVLKRMGVEKQTALLVEGSSYGLQEAADTAAEAAPDASFQPIRIPFPLNIAALRSAYDRNPEGEEERPPLRPRVQPRLPMSLRSEPRETEPSRSLLTPPTIDLIMEDIVATLRAHDVKAVGIVASDIRDKLFLAEALRSRLPGIHLFTYEGNALFRRTDFGPTLRGMVVASTYPLLMESQTWMADTLPLTLLPFSNEQAAGVFNAALHLMGETSSMRGYHTLPDRGTTLQSGPPVWLTVAGRDRTLPLMAARPAEAGHLAAGPPPRPVNQQDGHAHGTGYLQTALGLLAILAVALVVLVWFPRKEDLAALLPRGVESWGRTHIPAGAATPSYAVGLATLALSAGAVSSRTMGADLPASVGTCAAASSPWLLLGVGLALALGAAIVRTVRRSPESPWLRRDVSGAVGVAVLASAVPVAYLLSKSSAWDAPVGACAGLVSDTLSVAGALIGIGLVFSLLHGLLRVATPGKGDGPVTIGRRVVAWGGRHLAHAMALGLGVVTFFYVRDLMGSLGQDPVTFSLYRFRALSLDSGLSPLPVFFLATVGILAGILWTRNHEELLRQKRPVSEMAWPKGSGDGGDDAAPGWLSAFRVAAESAAKLDVRLRNVAIPLLVAAGLAAVVFTITPHIQTLEAVTFGETAWTSRLLLISILTGFCVTAAASVHLVLLWLPLKSGLSHLAQTPLVHRFEHLPSRLRPLGRLHLFDPPADALGVGLLGEGYRTLRQRIREADAATASLGADLPDPVPDGDPDPAGTRKRALTTVARLLHRAWSSDAASIWEKAMGVEGGEAKDVGGGTAAKGAGAAAANAGRGEEQDAGKPSASPEGGSPSRWLAVAELVGCLEIARYIEWVLRHIRRTALLLLVTTLLTTASLEVLPVAYHDVVTRALILLVGASIVTLFVVMSSLAQDEILSRINGSPPGKLSWNGASILNVAVFMALPVIALLGTEVPAVGRTLFAWLTDLMRLFNGV